MKYIKHIFILLFIKIPVQLSGLLILPYIAYKYKVGCFPTWCKWFDDVRARVLIEKPELSCIDCFGRGHCELFSAYNSSWKGRYVWSAFRNSCNYFQHYVLGKEYDDSTIWLYKRDGIFRVRIGYKIGDTQEYRDFMKRLGIPAQWVFSIGLRLNQK